jgi:MFS family permease
MAALCYQVLWQRLLFAWFGVDLESMTVIVSVFMFGFGIGAYLGGSIADRFPDRLVAIFGGIESAIGAFGLVSASLVSLVGEMLAGGPLWLTAVAAFAILAIPTTLMGATLPVLVIHLNQNDRHIGRSVGSLYFSNTLGAAAGVALAGFWLLDRYTVDQILKLAAFTNIAVGGVAWAWLRKTQA